MSTTELREQIIQLVQSTTDESKLKVAFNALKDDHDWWDDLTKEQQASINRGLKDVEEGRVTPHTEVRKEIDQLLSKYA